MEVTVDVDFGDRPRVVRKVAIERGADVVTATRAALPVEQDWLCCSPQDVWSIDGIGPDPRLDRYWSWRLGCAPGPDLPARHRLQGGETVVWKYGGGTLPNRGSVRVVSLLPAATEIAIAVGGEASLVALSHLCRQPDRANLPRVMRTRIDSDTWSMGRIDDELRKAGRAGTPLYELDEAAIRALRPTHVLSQGLCPVCAVTPEQVGAMLARDAERCAQLVVLSPRSLADIANDIRTVGATLGRTHAGKVAARAFERRLDAVRALPPLPQRPRVAVLEWFDPLWASGEWIAEMVEVAGGEPVLVGKDQPSRRLDWAELTAAAPDVVVLAGCSMSIERAERELPALVGSDAWRQLPAVQKQRVFLMDGERHFSTPGPGVAAGAEVLARLLRELQAGTAAASTEPWRQVVPR
ncbi:MAG: ABC transporter substrate-binding protein [Planctomycetes bacterium]|nr:ABC transporter substrate-binding protein [Planctomycetota bacterium]